MASFYQLTQTKLWNYNNLIMSFEATIIEVSPHCTYQGAVYEYRVVLGVDNIEFGCFDPDMHTAESMVGERRRFDLYASTPTEVRLAGTDDIGIYPNEKDPHDYTNHSICGRVISKSDGWPKKVELDVGTGTITPSFSGNRSKPIEYREMIESVERGDCLYVTVSRIDIAGIEPDASGHGADSSSA